MCGISVFPAAPAHSEVPREEEVSIAADKSLHSGPRHEGNTVARPKTISFTHLHYVFPFSSPSKLLAMFGYHNRPLDTNALPDVLLPSLLAFLCAQSVTRSFPGGEEARQIMQASMIASHACAPHLPREVCYDI